MSDGANVEFAPAAGALESVRAADPLTCAWLFSMTGEGEAVVFKKFPGCFPYQAPPPINKTAAAARPRSNPFLDPDEDTAVVESPPRSWPPNTTVSDF